MLICFFISFQDFDNYSWYVSILNLQLSSGHSIFWQNLEVPQLSIQIKRDINADNVIDNLMYSVSQTCFQLTHAKQQVMKKLQINLKQIETSLNQLSTERLNRLIAQLEQISVKAKDIVAQRSEPQDNANDENEYIEFEVNGQPDRIKKSIEVLNISCNNFETLPSVFYKLNNLKKLYLFNNQFSSEEKKKIRASFPPRVQIYF